VLGRLPLLPLAHDARITVLHVVPRGLTVSEQRKAERDAARAVADEVRLLRKGLPQSMTVASLVKVGATAKTISVCTTQLKAQLVVMSRGSGRLRDEFIGSTAERVIRQARVPVLVVRLAARTPYRRPAIAIAQDEAAYEAVAALLRMWPASMPPVSIIHAFDSPYRTFIYPTLADDAQRMDELHADATREIAKLLTKALARAGVLPENAPPWKPHIRFGPPRIVVEKAVKKLGVDLLVAGTHGYTGAPYLLLGTVAGDLLRQSKCDVLVVPPVPLATP
jgi:nucleotide-binding universal stress UspA family protein